MRIEALRLAGEKVGADRVGDRAIRVDNPYTGECIGTVPKATLADVRRAFDIAKHYKARLSPLRAQQHPEQGRGRRARAHGRDRRADLGRVGPVA